MKPSISLLILFFSYTLFAQTEFRKGYIITKKQDTIYGELDYRSDKIMTNMCTYKSLEGVVEKYTPLEIKAFRFTEGRYFVSEIIDGENVFLEFLFQGAMEVYSFHDATKGKKRYFIQKKEAPLTELVVREAVRDYDGRKHEAPNNLHKKILLDYTKEAPELFKDIIDIETLSKKNLISLAKKYHTAVAKSDDYIVYEKAKKRGNLFVEAQIGTGWNNSKNIGGVSGTIYLHTSIGMLGDKWYFQTGYDDLVGGIPLAIEHIYHKGPVRYRFSYGFFLLEPATFFQGGFNVKLNDKLFWSFAGNLYFSTNEEIYFIPNFNFESSIGAVFTGLMVKI